MLVDLGNVVLRDIEETQMTSDVINDAQLASGNQLLLRRTVSDGEEHVFTDRHHERTSLDAGECGSEITVGVT